MGQRKTKPVVTRTVADATPEGSIRRTAVTTGVDVDREYDAMNAPFGEGGGLFGMGNMPEMYNLVVNTNNDLISSLVGKEEAEQERIIKQSLDLARLSQNLLKGEELTNFVKRSFEMIK